MALLGLPDFEFLEQYGISRLGEVTDHHARLVMAWPWR